MCHNPGSNGYMEGIFWDRIIVRRLWSRLVCPQCHFFPCKILGMIHHYVSCVISLRLCTCILSFRGIRVLDEGNCGCGWDVGLLATTANFCSSTSVQYYKLHIYIYSATTFGTHECLWTAVPYIHNATVHWRISAVLHQYSITNYIYTYIVPPHLAPMNVCEQQFPIYIMLQYIGEFDIAHALKEYGGEGVGA